jgi:metal-responsive CopG/Arc/MetJ family transcriptional regulator
MRVRISITLPEDLIARLDRVDKNRSALLERAALACLAQRDRQPRDLSDSRIIDQHARRLNQEAADTLDYQRLP